LPQNTAAGQPPFPAQTEPLKISEKKYMSGKNAVLRS
jgi:hypothetical protein